MVDKRNNLVFIGLIIECMIFPGLYFLLKLGINRKMVLIVGLILELVSLVIVLAYEKRILGVLRQSYQIRLDIIYVITYITSSILVIVMLILGFIHVKGWAIEVCALYEINILVSTMIACILFTIQPQYNKKYVNNNVPTIFDYFRNGVGYSQLDINDLVFDNKKLNFFMRPTYKINDKNECLYTYRGLENLYTSDIVTFLKIEEFAKSQNNQAAFPVALGIVIALFSLIWNIESKTKLLEKYFIESTFNLASLVPAIITAILIMTVLYLFKSIKIHNRSPFYESICLMIDDIKSRK